MAFMQIPRRVDYGLRAVIYLAGQGPDKCCSITEIAQQQGVPKNFLEKIIQDLMRGGLIRSKRGSCGGYTLARPPEVISFRDVIEAIDGPIAINACLEQEVGCDRLPQCSMVNVWREVRDTVTEIFGRTTIAALRQTPCGDFNGSSSLSSAA